MILSVGIHNSAFAIGIDCGDSSLAGLRAHANGAVAASQTFIPPCDACISQAQAAFDVCKQQASAAAGISYLTAVGGLSSFQAGNAQGTVDNSATGTQAAATGAGGTQAAASQAQAATGSCAACNGGDVWIKKMVAEMNNVSADAANTAGNSGGILGGAKKLLSNPVVTGLGGLALGWFLGSQGKDGAPVASNTSQPSIPEMPPPPEIAAASSSSQSSTAQGSQTSENGIGIVTLMPRVNPKVTDDDPIYVANAPAANTPEAEEDDDDIDTNPDGGGTGNTPGTPPGGVDGGASDTVLAAGGPGRGAGPDKSMGLAAGRSPAGAGGPTGIGPYSMGGGASPAGADGVPGTMLLGSGRSRSRAVALRRATRRLANQNRPLQLAQVNLKAAPVSLVPIEVQRENLLNTLRSRGLIQSQAPAAPRRRTR